MSGCCLPCRGTGYDGTPETNGMCVDCRATGCAHPEPLCEDADPVLDVAAWEVA